MYKHLGGEKKRGIKISIPSSVAQRIFNGISICLLNCILTLLGSFMMRYLPCFSFIQMSIMHLSTPQALSMFRLIWLANSLGLNCCVPSSTCLLVSRTFCRETYLQPNIIAQFRPLTWPLTFSLTMRNIQCIYTVISILNKLQWSNLNMD